MNTWSFNISNSISELLKLEGLVEEISNTLQLSDSKKLHLNLILEESLTNILTHGYTTDNQEFIKTSISYTSNCLIICIIDSGIPFNPLENNISLENEATESLQIGGRGLRIIKNLSKHINYQRIDNQNILTIYFAL